MKHSFAFVGASLLALAALAGAVLLSGPDVLLWRAVLVLLALWMGHAASLSLQAARASHPLSAPAPGTAAAPFTSRSPGYGWFAAHTLLPPTTMRQSTAGLTLLALFVALYAWQAQSTALAVTAVVLALYIIMVRLRRNLLLYRAQFGGGACLKVEARGLLTLRPHKGQPVDEGLIVAWTPWSDVQRVYRRRACLVFGLKNGGTLCLPAQVGMDKALNAVAPYFRHKEAAAPSPVYTLHSAYRLLDDLAQPGTLLQPVPTRQAAPTAGSAHWGGVPDGGAAFVWPRVEGRPMRHVLQWRHEAGLLHLFADPDATLTRGDGNRGPLRVMLTPLRPGNEPQPAVCPDDALSQLLPLRPLAATAARFVPTFATYAATTPAPLPINATTYAAALARYEGEQPPLEARLAEGDVLAGGLPVEGSHTTCPVADAASLLLLQLRLPGEKHRLLTITMPRADYPQACFDYMQWDVSETK